MHISKGWWNKLFFPSREPGQLSPATEVIMDGQCRLHMIWLAFRSVKNIVPVLWWTTTSRAPTTVQGLFCCQNVYTSGIIVITISSAGIARWTSGEKISSAVSTYILSLFYIGVEITGLLSLADDKKHPHVYHMVVEKKPIPKYSRSDGFDIVWRIWHG